MVQESFPTVSNNGGVFVIKVTLKTVTEIFHTILDFFEIPAVCNGFVNILFEYISVSELTGFVYPICFFITVKGIRAVWIKSTFSVPITVTAECISAIKVILPELLSHTYLMGFMGTIPPTKPTA